MKKKKSRRNRAPLSASRHIRYDVKNRIIWLRGSIRMSASPKQIDRALRIIDKNNDSSQLIFLFITSQGGDFYAFFQIWQMLEPYAKRLVTIAHQAVFSSGLLLVQRGFRRFATPKTKFLVHGAANIIPECAPTSAELFEMGLECANINAAQLAILTQKSQSPKTIQAIGEMLAGERFFGNKKAKKLNLIDWILKTCNLKQAKREIVDYVLKELKKEWLK